MVDQTVRPATPIAPSATAHAVAAFVPQPPRERHGMALCLSGGGFRATLFHLGALRRLNELGILTQLDTVTSVSGGSIAAAHLATRAVTWPAPGEPLADWDRVVAAPLRAFTARNLRTRPLARRLLPWNWWRPSTAVEALARAYERRLTAARLPALATRPRFVLCATDMAFGVDWVFDSAPPGAAAGRLGDYQAGYGALPDWPLARAVAAASCCPPLFDPLPVGLAPQQLTGGAYAKPDRAALVAGIRLSDGGVYDNLGLEPVWKDHRLLLVSDGGAIFQDQTDQGLLWRVQRYAGIADRQSRALRKRWLIAGFVEGDLVGTYWGIGSAAAHYETTTPGYPEGLVDDVIARVRTDLDVFSAAEAAVLENHGYLLAEAAIRRHAADLIRVAAPLAIPHPAWMDEDRVRRDLTDSHKRTLLGRW